VSQWWDSDGHTRFVVDAHRDLCLCRFKQSKKVFGALAALLGHGALMFRGRPRPFERWARQIHASFANCHSVIRADENLTAFLEFRICDTVQLTRVGLISQTRPVFEVSVKCQHCVRRDEKESEINQADCPAEAPESDSDECEAYKAQRSM